MKILKKYILDEFGVELPEDATPSDFVDAYIKGKGTKVAIVYPQRMGFINITINNYCNLSCFSCDQFVDSAPSKDMMSLQQIKDFVKESQELGWNWEEIRITGGEPSLHPDFKEILNTLSVGLKQEYLPNITLKIISNGTGKKVRKILDIDNAKIERLNKVTDGFYLDHIGHPDWLVVCSKPLKDTMVQLKVKTTDAKEVEFIPDFGNVWQAPVDRLEEIKKFYDGDRGDIPNPPIDGYYPPNLTEAQWNFVKKENIVLDCQVHASCGFELSKNGIAPCGCGGGRVIGAQNTFFDSLHDITPEKCKEKLAKMCATCGQNMNYATPCSVRTNKTKFWELVLENYNTNEPKMELYDPFNRAEEQHED